MQWSGMEGSRAEWSGAELGRMERGEGSADGGAGRREVTRYRMRERWRRSDRTDHQSVREGEERTRVAESKRITDIKVGGCQEKRGCVALNCDSPAVDHLFNIAQFLRVAALDDHLAGPASEVVEQGVEQRDDEQREHGAGR